MKKYIVSFLFVGLLLAGGIVYAQGPQAGGPQMPPLGDNPNLMTEEQREKFQELKQQKAQEREEFREENQQKREDWQNKMVENREQAKNQLMANREALRAKLQAIKNEKKQNAVLNVSDNIEKINEKATDRLSNLVGNIEKVLNNIQTRVDKAKTDGLDITSVEIEINKAKAAISEAKDAISAQSGKTYTINVTNEKTLKEVVKTVRDTFHADIKAVQEKVKAAHEAVRNSAKTLASIISLVVKEEGTETEE